MTGAQRIEHVGGTLSGRSWSTAVVLLVVGAGVGCIFKALAGRKGYSIYGEANQRSAVFAPSVSGVAAVTDGEYADLFAGDRDRLDGSLEGTAPDVDKLAAVELKREPPAHLDGTCWRYVDGRYGLVIRDEIVSDAIRRTLAGTR